MRLFLGQVNVKQFRDGERFRFFIYFYFYFIIILDYIILFPCTNFYVYNRLKQEYEKFKRKTNPQFMLFIILLYIFPESQVLTTFWQV